MANKKIDVKIRLERQEKKILKMREELEKAQDEYEELVKERDAQEKEDLYALFKKSRRSFDEVAAFMKGKADI